MFQRLEGDTCVLRQGGVFKVAALYNWRDGVYAAVSGGYVRLRANGTTSKPSLTLEGLEISTMIYSDTFGRLSLDPNAGPLLCVIPGSTLQIYPVVYTR